MKVALVHDWLIYMRGAERVLEAFCELYPDADLYTLFHRPGAVSPTIEHHRITTSMIQHCPWLRTRYGSYLPLFPLAIERFDLRGYDLVLSSSHCVAKGVITSPETCHISYLHTPMLYVWDDFHHYFPQTARFSWVAALLAHYLKLWDATSASRVDYLVTISHHLARRVLKRYRRRAVVIYPPVDTEFYSPGDQGDDFFLVVSALVPRKQIDLAIQVFNHLNLPLKIAGSGWREEERRLRELAGPNVEFLGWLDEEGVRDHVRRCRALILPGAEDFGIAPVEAQACGKPVIAYAKGAALETIVPLNFQQPSVCTQVSPDVDHATGIFFYEPTVEALQEAIRLFEVYEARFNRQGIRQHSLRFGKDVFKARITGFVEEKVAKWSGYHQKEGVSL